MKGQLKCSHKFFVETKNFEIINEESSKQDWNLEQTSNFVEKIVTIINIHTNNVPKGLIERPTKVLCKDLINNNNIFVVKKNPPEPYELEERHTY
jgi:hypothetical protein